MTEYRDKPVTPGQQARDFTQSEDPFELFARWMEEAIANEPVDPNAMAVATVDADGLPNVRTILLKGADARGFVFYTNCGSAKGHELAGEPVTPAAIAADPMTTASVVIDTESAKQPATFSELRSHLDSSDRDLALNALQWL